MRALTFLSRFTLICNIAFVAYAVFRWLENSKSAKASSDMVTRVPFIKEVIIILGFSAIIINLIMNVGYLFLIVLRKEGLPWKLILINFLFLILQVFYFFFYNA
jgi:hypothetical protein